MGTTSNASPIAIHGHTMCIGLPNTKLSLSAHELRSEMERAMGGSTSVIDEIRLTGDVEISGPADRLFSHMPCLRQMTNLDKLDVSQVTSMRGMFAGDLSLESPDLVAGMSFWDMSHVEHMDNMFEGCQSLESIEITACRPDLGALKSVGGMFHGCSSLTSVDMSFNETPSLENVACLFMGCTSLDGVNLRRIDTSHVTNMNAMFKDCKSLRDLSLDDFDASAATHMKEMFSGCTNLIRISAHDSKWPDADRVASDDMFRGCNMLSDISTAAGIAPLMDKGGLTQDVLDARRKRASALVRREGEALVLGEVARPMHTDGLNLRHEVLRLCDQGERPKRIEIVGDIRLSGDASYLFSPCTDTVESIEGMEHLDTSRVTDMSGMFCGMYALKSVNVSGFDTRSVTSMRDMFCGCGSLEAIDVSHFDTRNVEDMSYMFEDCPSLRSLDLSSLDVSNVTSAACLCNQCTGLESASIAGWNAPNLVDASGLFGGCSKLAELDTTGFSTARVADTNNMFAKCQSLEELDLRGLSGTSKCASYMFYKCPSLRTLDIRSLEVDSSTPSNHTFTGCDALKNMRLTTSMVHEMEYQETERHNTIIVDASQLRPAKDGWAISLALSDGSCVRQRTLLAPDGCVRDNGDGTLDVELPTLVRVGGVEGGQEVSELTNARAIHYQSDVARRMQDGKAAEPMRTPAPDDIDYEDDLYDEIPF